MSLPSDLSLVDRRSVLGLLSFALVPVSSLAANAEADSCAPATLTAEQFERMYKRLMGKWRLIPEKSTFFVGSAPKNPSSFIYTPAPEQGLGFTNENGPSISRFDGKLYNAAP